MATKKKAAVPDFLCIVAGQRSGTTALQSQLGSSGGVANFGEIFHTDDNTINKNEGSFFRFARDNGTLLWDMRNVTLVEKMAADYMAHLTKLSQGKISLIDVKFNSWDVLRPPWRYIHQEPFFFAHCKQVGAKFIMIWRGDLTDQILSEMIARKIDRWHNVSGVEEGTERFSVPIPHVANKARLICQSERFFYTALKTHPGTIIVKYEALYVDDQLSQDFLDDLEVLVGRKLPIPATPKIRKNRLQKSDIVENYEEARAAVEDVVSKMRLPELLDKDLRFCRPAA